MAAALRAVRVGMFDWAVVLVFNSSQKLGSLVHSIFNADLASSQAKDLLAMALK